jgi:hypothetical protein
MVAPRYSEPVVHATVGIVYLGSGLLISHATVGFAFVASSSNALTARVFSAGIRDSESATLLVCSWTMYGAGGAGFSTCRTV